MADTFYNNTLESKTKLRQNVLIFSGNSFIQDISGISGVNDGLYFKPSKNVTIDGNTDLKGTFTMNDNQTGLSISRNAVTNNWDFETNTTEAGTDASNIAIVIKNKLILQGEVEQQQTTKYAGSSTFLNDIFVKVNENDNDASSNVFIPGGANTSDNAIQFNIHLDASSITVRNNMTVNGDLTINGNMTTISTTNLDISDNIIVLNKGAKSKTNAGLSGINHLAGIQIETGSDASDVKMQWNFNTNKMEFINTNNENLDLLCKTVETSSDLCLKEDIVPILNSKELIQQFKPVYWKWKNTHKKSCGLVAQDVMKIAPDAVGGNKDSLALNYNYFIGLLISRVQEMEFEMQSFRKI